MKTDYGLIHRQEDYRDRAACLNRLPELLQKAQAQRSGPLFLEAGLIEFKYGERRSAYDHFKQALALDTESVFTLVGLSHVVPLEPELGRQVMELAEKLDSGLHEDGSMESAVPYYENIVKTSKFIYSGPGGMIKKTLNQMRLKSGKVLDVGTGPAPFALALREYLPSSFDIIGYDISLRMLGLARGIVFGLNKGIDLVWGPLIEPAQKDRTESKLPFESESLNLIVSHGSMHHWGGGNENLPAVEAMIKELWRILQPGGRILIIDIDPQAFGTRFIVKSGIMKYLDRSYQHEAFVHSAEHSLDRKQIGSVLEKCGINSDWRTYPARPYFPAGLLFYVVDIQKLG